MKRLKSSKKINFSFFLLLFFAASFIHAKNYNAPLLPYKTENPPVIDGRLDDEVWQKAPYVSGFKTWVPDYGIDMKYGTEAYYSYDQENIYVAFRCFDSEPNKIKSSVTSLTTSIPMIGYA